MRVETIAEQLFFTTCLIKASGEAGSRVGTGFVYVVDTNAGAAHFLVTNKQVLKSADKVAVRMIQQTASGEPSLGKVTQITLQPFNDSVWMGHPDPVADVGVMPLGNVLQQMHAGGAPAFFTAVTPGIALSSEKEQELDAIEDVTFIGYPNGLYDTANGLPILRTGTTATPISVDYRGAPAFLIDASVFPGSSGSPVFIANRGFYTDRHMRPYSGDRLIFLGVLAAVHTRQVEGSVDVLPSSRLVTAFNEPIDLGIVYKARCIDECVQHILQLKGLTRIQSPALIETSTEASSADDVITDRGTAGTGDRGLAFGRPSGGFDKGRWPVSLLGDRAGFWPARISPIWAIARVPLSNPPRPRDLSGRLRPPRALLSRQPTGAGAAGAGAKARAPRRRRERPGGPP
jgi:V8-like Glu-specific endopeptidase